MAKCSTCGKGVGLLPGQCEECIEKELQERIARQKAHQRAREAAQLAKQQAIEFLAVHTTTAFELPGCCVLQTFGVVRGLSVRSPKIGQGFMANLETIGGGENNSLAKMCDDARQAALQRMWEAAYAVGANGVIGCRYDTAEIAPGITEVLCYGTAVALEAAHPGEDKGQRRGAA